ncbi:hypothetical protein [Xenorhabdus sp. KJ12.1]|uniref:hypothetical protein n=1 Tax=Xenorhabdus sp. KJ12.1 TaxID=1851571 RepID=UPI000C056F32|nr:hypothetical protein [Xenorhabdus sp. KJ12.1]PHM72260.1 hypothetical protein Xekj_00538 [Xenorhabdus sp. KJ12.1]
MNNDLLEKRNNNTNEKNRYIADNNAGGFFLVECQRCGKVYKAHGYDRITDTCDYNDILCPHCGLGCNTHQKRILALEAELALLRESNAQVIQSRDYYKQLAKEAIKNLESACNKILNELEDF